MQLSENTIKLLAEEMNCEEADKVYDQFINEAVEAYVYQKNLKTYFTFQTVGGKIFLTKETRN